MRTCILNGSEIKTKDELHDILIRELDLPQWYGRNLDALYDCLTDVCEDTLIRLIDADVLSDHLKGYASGFKKVLLEAAAENKHLHVEI